MAAIGLVILVVWFFAAIVCLHEEDKRGPGRPQHPLTVTP
jgi:hypothetical protein